MDNDKNLSPQESLSIIQTMLQKARNESYNESGTSTIMWGSVITFCGFVQAAEIYWNFYIGFDIWLLTFIAIIPQVYISIRESKNKKVRTYQEEFLTAVWIVFGVSIFALVAYTNFIPYASERLLANENKQLFIKNLTNNDMQVWHPYVFSLTSLYLMLYAIPTLITGLATKFKPMIWGAILCYILFIASLYTSTTIDMIFMAVSAIFNWLIPGIILRKEYFKAGIIQNV
jgi:hypothetical protein